MEATAGDSLVEGLGKGVASDILHAAYPFVAGAYKAVEGYAKAKNAAKEVGLYGGKVTEAGLKGALVGGIKGFAHGLLDTMIITAITGLGFIASGPVGAAVGALLGAGFYNVVKNEIRK
ncbi:MAG: hypothetical protein ACK4GR_00870 [bacterium]